MSSAVLIYDSECGLCRETKKWIDKHNKNGKIEFLPCRSLERIQRFPQISEEQCLAAVCLIDEGGEIYFGAEAMEQIIRVLFNRRAAALSALPVFRFFTRRIYAWIAAHRLTISCLVVDPSSK